MGVYLDPAARAIRVKGSFLPFARVFFFVGGADDYNGDSYYSLGGDLGVTAMVNRTVGLEMSYPPSKDRVTNVPVYREHSPLYDRKTGSGTTIQVSMGLTGFLF